MVRGMMRGSVDGNLQRGGFRSGGILANWLSGTLAEDGPGRSDTKDGVRSLLRSKGWCEAWGFFLNDPSRFLLKVGNAGPTKTNPEAPTSKYIWLRGASLKLSQEESLCH